MPEKTTPGTSTTLAGLILCGAMALAPRATAQPPAEAGAPVAARGAFAPTIAEGGAWKYEFGLRVMSTTQWLDGAGEPASEPVESLLIQGATVALRVESIDAETGVATIAGRFERLTTVWRDALGQAEAQWTPGSRADASAGSLGAILSALGSCALTLKVAPDGEVRGVTGLGPALAALDGQERFTRDALGVFAPGVVDRTFERVWRVEAVHDSPATAGAEWTSRRAVLIGGGLEIDLESAWRVEGERDGIVEWRATTSPRALAEGAPDAPNTLGMRLLGDARGQAVIRWNRLAGCLETRRDRTPLDAEWTLAGQRLRQDVLAEWSAARAGAAPIEPPGESKD